MHSLLLIHAGLLLISKASALSKNCVELDVSVPVMATNRNYTIPQVDNDVDAVQWALDFSVWNMKSPQGRDSGKDNGDCRINEIFLIRAELCVPLNETAKAGILQIAVHGNGWDRRYWNVSVNSAEHSYVDAAISRGYSILMFDRLGTGQSEKPDAYKKVQGNTEAEILFQLTSMVRNGTLLRSSKVVGATGLGQVREPSPKHIVHVGHSIGSLVVLGLLIKHGDMSDAALLTGALPNSTHLTDVKVAEFEHGFARDDDPLRFGDFGSGYVVLGSENTLQKLYFVEGGFEPALLNYTELVKQPEAVALYASNGQFYENPGAPFRGPVQLLCGVFDLINCNGYCPGTYTVEGIKTSTFPTASNVSVYLQPNTGHALTVAKNATGTFKVMFDYLDEVGF